MSALNPRISLPGLRVIVAMVVAATVAGCASSGSDGWFGKLRPYRIEVVQGNVVTQEMVANLREGLSRDQVRGLLGSPLLTDIFHADRWDYVFTIRRQGAEPQSRRVTVFFSGDKVRGFEADGLPSENEFVSSIDTGAPKPRTKPLVLNDEQLQKLPLPEPSRIAPAVTPVSGPQRSYPPLEPAIR